MQTRLLRHRSLQWWFSARGQRPPDGGMRSYVFFALSEKDGDLKCAAFIIIGYFMIN